MSLVAEMRAERKARLIRLGRITQQEVYSPPPAPVEPEVAVLDWSAGIEGMWCYDLVSAPKAKPPSLISVKDIQLAVAEYYGVRMNDILSHRRTVAVALPRHVAMYLASKLTRRSAADIGRRFNRRDHTTVLHAIKKIEALYETDSGLFGAITQLRRRDEPGRTGCRDGEKFCWLGKPS